MSLSTEFNSPQGPAHGREIKLDRLAVEQALKYANLMADAAGKAILPHFRALQQVENKVHSEAASSRGRYDPVTVGDRNAEQAIREVIARYCPEDGIYGEEYGYKETRSGLTWVLDPIDGTRGFVCGLTTWGTLISLYNGCRSVLGVMDQPVIGERFVGLVGEGGTTGVAKDRAYVENRGNRQSLNCSNTTRIEEALLCITSPDIYHGEHWPLYEELTGTVASTRYGTDCYGYAMLASGYVDLVVEPDLEPYDIQALIPLIEAAGGVVTDWSGADISGGGNIVAAANAQLHKKVLAMIMSYSPIQKNHD